jgi:hypothetical protein
MAMKDAFIEKLTEDLDLMSWGRAQLPTLVEGHTDAIPFTQLSKSECLKTIAGKFLKQVEEMYDHPTDIVQTHIWNLSHTVSIPVWMLEDCTEEFHKRFSATHPAFTNILFYAVHDSHQELYTLESLPKIGLRQFYPSSKAIILAGLPILNDIFLDPSAEISERKQSSSSLAGLATLLRRPSSVLIGDDEPSSAKTMRMTSTFPNKTVSEDAFHFTTYLGSLSGEQGRKTEIPRHAFLAVTISTDGVKVMMYNFNRYLSETITAQIQEMSRWIERKLLYHIHDINLCFRTNKVIGWGAI